MSSYIIHNGVLMSEELYHHGIKGQKWGVRRFQKKDGSLTSAGKKRYYDTPELNRQKKAVKAASVRLNTAKGEEYSIAAREYNHAKLRYSTNKELARMRDKDIRIEKKSKHRQQLEEKYKQIGMSDEQAEAAANKRIRTEKIVAGTAAVAVTACAAYVANKQLQDRVDRVIKSGTTLQRIEMKNTDGKLYDVFYAAKGSHDHKRYMGLLGKTRQMQTGEAYLMNLKAAGNIKVASKENARKTFESLYKSDPDFRSAVKGFAKKHFSGENAVDVNNLSKRNMKKMYENFNSALLHIRDEGSGADKKFYDALKAKGYGAIQDINDMKFSGYNAKNPLIVFGNSSSKNVMVESVRKLTEDLSESYLRESKKTAMETLVREQILPRVAGGTAGLAATSVYLYAQDPTKQYKTQRKKMRW